MHKQRLWGNCILMFTAMIWGAAFSFQSMAMKSMTPLCFVAARMASATLFIWVVYFALRKIRAKKGTKKARGVGEKGLARIATFARRGASGKALLGGAICGFFIYAGSVLQQIGIVHTSAGKAAFLTALYTVLVPLFAVAFFGRKLPREVFAGAGLAALGLYLLTVREGFGLAPSDFLLIGCAACFAMQILSIDIFVKKTDPVLLSASQFTFCMIYAFAGALIFEEPSFEMMTSAVGPVLYAGIVSGGIGYTFQIIGQKLTDPATGAVILSLESLFGAIFGAMLLHEIMPAREIIGGLIMLAAVMAVQYGAAGKTAEEKR